MSTLGTKHYADTPDLPEVVAAAVALATELDFPASCRPEQGRLLQALAAGAPAAIGETGTGCGVGLAWLAAGRRPGVRLVSVERDESRAELVAGLFADVPEVDVLREWPLSHQGALDRARLYWLEHPALLATEIRLAPDLSTIVATRRP